MSNNTNEPKNRQERAAENVEQFFSFTEKIQTEAYQPIKSGLKFYDDLMDGGPSAQTLTILLAEQGAGKTILMQQLAESIATKQKRRVVYLNFEMPAEQLFSRALSARIYAHGKIEMTQKQILRGYLWTDRQRSEVLDTIDEYKRESLPYISYNPKNVKPDLEALECYLDELSKEPEHAPALFVDYLQLIQSDRRQEIKDRLTQALVDLKQYAIKNNTIVFLISAINRETKKSGKKITASSARDTSAIEYQADYLISLENYKDQAKANKNGRQRMILYLLKNRDGKSGLYSIIERDGKNNLFVDADQPGSTKESAFEIDDETEIEMV